MNILILGSKTHSVADIGKVILHTDDPMKIEPAVNAAAAEGYVRFYKIVNPLGIPVVPTAAPKPAAKPPAEEKADGEAKPTKPAKK